MSALIDNILTLTGEALPPVEAVFDAAKSSVREMVVEGERVSGAKLEEHQAAAHALSWLATYTESLRQMNAWASRLNEAGQLGEMETLLLQIAFGEYLAQIKGGMMMSQNEMARLSDMGGTVLHSTPMRSTRWWPMATARQHATALLS